MAQQDTISNVELQYLKFPFTQKSKSKMSVAVVDASSPQSVLDLALEGGFQHVVQGSQPHTEAEVSASVQMLNRPYDFFKWPACMILSPSAINDQNEKNLTEFWHQIRSSDHKETVLDQVRNYCQKLTKSSTLLNEISLAADELLTNAIFNAPFVDQENSHHGIDRQNAKVDLHDPHRAELFIAHDEGRIVLGCRDSYGSLNWLNLLKRIRGCFRQGADSMMNFGDGGAGIGSYMVFNSCHSYYLAVCPKQMTLICCSFLRSGSLVARENAPKNLHCFTVEINP